MATASDRADRWEALSPEAKVAHGLVVVTLGRHLTEQEFEDFLEQAETMR